MARMKSYELWFSVNDKDVAKQLQNIDKSLRDTTSEYKLLKTSLSNGWDTDKWKRAQQISSKAVEDTATKVKLLKDRLAEMEREGVSNDTKAAFEKLKREITAAENAAQSAKKRLQEIDNLKLDNIRKTIKYVSDRLTSMGKALSIGVTAPIVAAGTASVKMAADMQESINKVDVSFGSAAKSVHEFSNTTLLSYGIAKSTALEMAGYFGDMATSSKFSQQEAAKMSMQLVALAGDIASFKNISLSEAKTALSAIFTGETESLKKLGIVMTQTNLDAYALEKGIKKTTQEMTENEKISLRMSYIFEKTANSQGDFARTSDSTANQLRLLTESLKELAAIAGEELLPIVTPIIANINELIQKIGNLDDGTKDIITKIAIFAASFGPLLIVTGTATKAINSMIVAYQAVKAALVAKQAADAAATTSQSALNVAMAANPAGAIATAIGILVAALGSYAIMSELTSSKSDTLSQKLKNLDSDFKNVSDSIDDSVGKQNAELSIIEKLVPRYEELNKKTDKTAEKKAELKWIVDQINDVMPDTIKLIDDEKGKYDALAESIYDTVEARKAEIQAIANRDRAIEAQKSQQELLDSLGYTDISQAQAELDKLKNYKTKPGGFFSDFFADYNFANVDSSALEKAISDYEKYQAIIDKYVGTGSKGPPLKKGPPPPQTSEEALANFKSAREKLDHQLAMDEISEKTYYSKLESISKQYLSGYAELESERNNVAERVYKYRKSLKEEEVAAEKKRLEEIAKAEREANKQRLKDAEEFTDKVISLAEEEANAKIKAIDAELAAREKLKEEQDQELKLQQAMAQLAFTRDGDSRESLKREIDRLKADIQESKIKADAEAQKAAIQAELDQLKRSASDMVSQMQSKITPESINPYITQLSPNLTVNASGLTATQAEQLIWQMFNKIMYGR